MTGKYAYLFVAMFCCQLLLVNCHPVKAQFFADTRNDVFGVGGGYGIGLGAPLISSVQYPGYSGSTSPDLMLTYEHLQTEFFGTGIMASFSTASYTGNNIPYTIYSPTGNVISTGLSTIQVNGTFITGAFKPAFHYIMNRGSVDLYGGGLLGFLIFSNTTTTTTAQGSYPDNEFNINLLFGAVIGARFYFSNSVGVWIEGGYSGFPDYLVNGGIVYKM